VGGPLGEGVLDGDYVTYPWQVWKFHWQTGKTRPEVGDGSVPTYGVKVEGGMVYVDLAAPSPRKLIEHPPYPLARVIGRPPGPIRVVGVSTTNDESTVSTDEHIRIAVGEGDGASDRCRL
jgi:hypothetical protein